MANNHTRYVSVGKESTYNTAVSASAIAEAESESFQQSFDVLNRGDMNYYGSAKAIVSKKIVEGSINLPLQPDDFCLMMLHGIMGVDNGSSRTNFSAVFSEIPITASTTLPSYTIRVGRDDKEHIFPGQVVDSVSVSASIGEYAMMTVNMVGAQQNSSTGTLQTAVPTYTGDAAHFANAYVRFDNIADTTNYSKLIHSIDFEIKTNRDMDNAYALGSDTCVRSPPVTMREITGSITFHKSLLAADVTLGEPYFDELMGATQQNAQAVANPGSAAPAMSVRFDASPSSAAGTRIVRFDFYKLHYEMPETSVSGRDSQTMTVNFSGLYDVGDANAMCKITWCTDDSGVVADYDS